MKWIYKLYVDAYSGLDRSSWLIAFITLINRSGMMVLPFLGLYLTEDLKYSNAKAGIVLSIFGIGSMVGSLLGGYLSDRIGHFRIVFTSLFFGGILYILLAFISTYSTLCIAVFFASVVNEALRPALTSSVSFYATKENTTRSFSLLRMAVNLGASIGPALAGLLAVVGYFWIFIGDGFTSITAALTYYYFFKGKGKLSQNKGDENSFTEELSVKKDLLKQNPLKDILFLLFCLGTLGYAIVFFQLWSSIPLFYKQVHFLPEPEIGILLALNGLLVFIIEMPLVHRFENKIPPGRIIKFGVFFLALGIASLNFSSAHYILYVSMLLMSISEILAMPFMMTAIIRRSGNENRGKYIGIYSMTWSSAFIFAPLLGTYVIEHFNYTTLWWVLCGICCLTFMALHFCLKKIAH
ncbi:MAG: MFS transporter [Chitinophagales bacterium]